MMLKTLIRFCEPSNKIIDTPFSIGDYSYATDGYIAIRTLRLPEVEEACSFRPKSIVSIFEQAKSFVLTANFTRLEHIEKDHEMIECVSCRGSGKVTDCPECDGEGEVYWTSDRGNEYSDECAECYGIGKKDASSSDCKKCETCDGTGEIFRAKSIFLNGKCFSAHLINKINTLPNAEIYLDFTNPEDGLPPVYFKFDGGYGIIMQSVLK
jgi:RecJ-like exonuclease